MGKAVPPSAREQAAASGRGDAAAQRGVLRNLPVGDSNYAVPASTAARGSPRVKLTTSGLIRTAASTDGFAGCSRSVLDNVLPSYTRPEESAQPGDLPNSTGALAPPVAAPAVPKRRSPRGHEDKGPLPGTVSAARAGRRPVADGRQPAQAQTARRPLPQRQPSVPQRRKLPIRPVLTYDTLTLT